MPYLVASPFRRFASCRCPREECMNDRIGGLRVVSVEVRSYARCRHFVLAFRSGTQPQQKDTGMIPLVVVVFKGATDKSGQKCLPAFTRRCERMVGGWLVGGDTLYAAKMAAPHTAVAGRPPYRVKRRERRFPEWPRQARPLPRGGSRTPRPTGTSARCRWRRRGSPSWDGRTPASVSARLSHGTCP